MPCICTKVTCKITKEKEEVLKTKFGEMITQLPGKSEGWLMLSFEDNCRLYFKGEGDKPSAFLEVKLFGKADAASYNKLTASLTHILSQELDIPSSSIYIQYQETEYWGFNGSNF